MKTIANRIMELEKRMAPEEEEVVVLRVVYRDSETGKETDVGKYTLKVPRHKPRRRR